MPLLLQPREQEQGKGHKEEELAALASELPMNGQAGPALEYLISDSARVVYVSSDAFLAGSFHDSLWAGNSTGLGDLHGELIDNCDPNSVCCPVGHCPDGNSYARAKLSNVLHTYELQKRIDAHAYTHNAKSSGKVRRVVTAAMHPGAVATNIHPVFSNSLTNWPMRAHLEAARIVVYAAMENTFIPSSFIDAQVKPHDLFQYYSSQGELETHFEAWPEAQRLQFSAAAENEYMNRKMTSTTVAVPAGVRQGMSYHRYLFQKKDLLHTGEPWGIAHSLSTISKTFPLSLYGVAMNMLFAITDGILSVLRVLDGFNVLRLHDTDEEIMNKYADAANALLSKKTASARLWDVSSAIVNDFSAGKKKYLQTPVTTSKLGLNL